MNQFILNRGGNALAFNGLNNRLGLILAIVFFLINIYGYFVIYYDKKKAIHHQWRVAERKLFIIALLGGATGIFLGMKAFRHKTKHLLFTHGIPLFIILNIVIYYLLVINAANFSIFLFFN
ncbi:MAG TPA: DUF1294 domain-containing protein [Firmicutes bacterium]|nr:DUF1294 domain-containing protein [Bacillota bacterium]